jgi:hypothetical protein
VVQFDPKRVFVVEFSGFADQYLIEVVIDAPISNLVGVSQDVAEYLATNFQMLKPGLSGTQVSLNIA